LLQKSLRKQGLKPYHLWVFTYHTVKLQRSLRKQGLKLPYRPLSVHRKDRQLQESLRKQGLKTDFNLFLEHAFDMLFGCRRV